MIFKNVKTCKTKIKIFPNMGKNVIGTKLFLVNHYACTQIFIFYINLVFFFFS